ncbi:MFS transporter [Leifsonia kafniensis]|uniref:MFS transporter n=1 Tax=Leifsonia kafniensis TaxID=475957 RepID=A0ABP7KMT5_9MICO
MRQERTAGLPHPSAILAIILVSYFMILLDNSIIFTGLPHIQKEMGLSATGLAWVQDAYTLVFGGFLLLGARAGDLLGRRRVFVVGLAVFSAASLLIVVAPAGWWLIAARALQGIGAAIVAPSSLSLLTASFPEGRERTRAVAWYGATAGIGASLGLVIGGALANWISWRAGFFINVPIGILMIVLAPRFVPETPRATGRFDLIGAITATLGMGALVFGVISSADLGWGSPETIVSLAAGVILLALFVFTEWRAQQPIMPLRLFASRERSGAYLARLLYLGAMIGFFYFTTQFLQGVLGYNPMQAGLAFLPMTVVNFAIALLIPRLRSRFSNAALLTVGVALTLAGMVLLSRVGVDSSYLSAVALPMVLLGVGQGLAFAPLTSAGIAGVTATDAGAASGLVNTAHQLGSALGIAVLVTVSANAGSGSGAVASLAAQVSSALTAGSVLLALCLLTALALIVPAEIAARRANVPHVSATRDPRHPPLTLAHRKDTP